MHDFHTENTMQIDEVRFDIPDRVLESVNAQLKRSYWPSRLGDGGWKFGVSHDFMRRFVDYWINEFDWRKTEAELNRWPQFRVTIGGVKVHFYHVRGEGNSPRPLLLTHGWPGSILEFLPLIGPLTQPSLHGGDSANAFDVIIPSVPGFGASDLPDGHEMGPVMAAELWRTLMVDVLGYERFGIQGGDFGAIAGLQMADRFPQHVAAMHLNAFPVEMGAPNPDNPDEMAYVEEVSRSAATEYGYMNMHAFKTNTVSFALSGNPLGTAAWILEKFYAWSDNDGDILDAFTMEQLCANVAFYVYTDAIGSSVRFYEGFNRELTWQFHPGHRIEVPTGIAVFPGEIIGARPPRSWAERQYDIRRWTEMPRGGHFAAMEQPGLLLEDVQAFFRDYL